MEFSYLLGAGASANIIPTVKKFPNALDEFSTFVRQAMNDSFNEDEIEIRDSFLLDLFELVAEANKHASIDTYAKKLFLTDQQDKLKKLKALLDTFLTAFQMANELDMRYDAFLATLLNSNNAELKLPANINILSWNYDFQFERALSNFLLSKDISSIEDKFKFIPNQKSDFDLKSEFSLIKLNGSSGALIDNKGFKRKDFLNLQPILNYQEIPEAGHIETSRIYRRVIINYNIMLKQPKNISSIMFAWEKNNITNKVRNYAINKTKKTDILIVIGYSFPTFNREIDKNILNNMENLKKIVIQAPINDIESIEFRIKSLLNKKRKIEIQKFSALDEFFIPFEL